MLFCDHCNKPARGYLFPMDVVREIRGVRIVLPKYEVCLCEHCGRVLYDEKAEAAITARAIEVYRSKARLLTQDQLSALINKIGAKELAERAKCSVSEIVNSVHGGVHSRKTDEALRHVLADMNAIEAVADEVA